VTGAFGTVPGLLLLPYLTDTLGVAAGVAGLLVLAPKAWDVLVNPVAGRLSDRTRTRWGARRPYLLFGGFALAILFAAIFAGVSRGAAGAIWVCVAFMAAATAFAFFQVPYVAMPAEITSSYAERTRLMSWRVALLALAILLSGASAPAIRDAVGGRDGYRLMGVVVAGLILVGTLGAYLGTRGAPTGRVGAAGGTLREQLRVVAGSRDFRLLLTTFVVQALGIGAMLAGVDYMARVVLEDRSSATVLFVCFVGPALLLTPAWARVGDTVGKKAGYVAASLFLATGALLLVLATAVPPVVVYLATGLVGVGYAGAQVFPMAMLPDTAAVDAARSGSNRAGVFTGVALGPGIFGLVLAAGGYVSTRTGSVTQPDSAVTAIVLGFSVLPAALTLASLWWLARYSLTPQVVAAATATGTHHDADPHEEHA
jgi:Na+/melibiose symporter-like transporter